MELSYELRKQIEEDISVCRLHNSINGSEKLIKEMIARYSIIDPDFAKSVCPIGKATIPGHECDYRNELSAAAARLETILLSSPKTKNNESRVVFSELVDQSTELETLFTKSYAGIQTIYSNKSFIEWKEKIKYELRKMRQDDTVKEVLEELDSFNGYNDKQTLASVISKCQIINKNLETYIVKDRAEQSTQFGNNIFIVHGHDTESKIEVARVLEKMQLKAIILHEQADEGKTIIEKLEKQVADAAFAIVIYTESDDIGRDKTKDEKCNQFRARQNVVFEHGLFIGALGRNRVCALVKGDIEKPGDLDGVVYVPMDSAGAWKMQLCKNMKAVGIDVDVNLIL